ncbi:hypothetical protein [uncultured Psychrosphaera sp.]|jgi:hypothetical protein|uniref:hypothetical protein n=1 Tax=uncultured Psychrosphaera sp. TaxID=1403522 RepID=UPI00261E42C5|nr:hypothetical protein [uncultured Psychrosphaera sp.]
MFKIFCIALVSFCLGIGATIGYEFWVLTATTNLEDKPEFSLNSRAFQDASSCLTSGSKVLVGRWQGKKEFDDGTMQTWVMLRKEDGTYESETIFFSEYGNEKHRESGLWSYSDCLYTSVTHFVGEHPVIYQEVYRVHELDDAKFVYTNYRTGNTYTIYRSL